MEAKHLGQAIVSVQIGRLRWEAIRVVIGDSNVYVNYPARDGSEYAHTSSHASGQHHVKIEGRYVCHWDGILGDWTPMKLKKEQPVHVEGRVKVATVGWKVSDIPTVLPPIEDRSEMVVNASNFPNDSILTLETSILTPSAAPRSEVLGFPIVQRYQLLQGMIHVEIEAFLLTADDAF